MISIAVLPVRNLLKKVLNQTPSESLLQRLGGYRIDRKTGREGFTMAGILMFGKEEAITDPECAPDFMVDYYVFRSISVQFPREEFRVR